MRSVLGMVLLAMTVGCTSDTAYRVDQVFENSCDVPLEVGSELVLWTEEAGGDILEVPDLDVALRCSTMEEVEPRLETCARGLDNGDNEVWYYTHADEALLVSMQRTSPDGSTCETILKAPLRDAVNVKERDLENAALVAAFIAAPPEVQVGAAAVAYLLSEMADGLSAIGYSSS